MEPKKGIVLLAHGGRASAMREAVERLTSRGVTQVVAAPLFISSHNSVIAHGPVRDDENKPWLEDMKTLASQMRQKSSYQDIQYLTVRDDAEDNVRNEATKELWLPRVCYPISESLTVLEMAQTEPMS